MCEPGAFRYWRDPLCVGAGVVYLLNRCWWKAVAPPSAWLVHGYLGDLLLLPVLVPIALAAQRRLGLRGHDGAPTAVELSAHWALWSWCFEWLGPRLPALAPGAVADPWDLVAYAAGGAAASCWWRGGFCARDHFVGAGLALRRAAVAMTLAIGVLGAYHAAPGGRLALDWPRRADDAAAHARVVPDDDADRGGVAGHGCGAGVGAAGLGQLSDGRRAAAH